MDVNRLINAPITMRRRAFSIRQLQHGSAARSKRSLRVRALDRPKSWARSRTGKAKISSVWFTFQRKKQLSLHPVGEGSLFVLRCVGKHNPRGSTQRNSSGIIATRASAFFFFGFLSLFSRAGRFTDAHRQRSGC